MNTATIEMQDTVNTLTPEMQALKARLKATWMAGDYGHFASTWKPGARSSWSALPVEPGTRLLDVACGAGQIVIPAARAGVRATGIDIATNSIDQARARAAAEGPGGPVRRRRRRRCCPIRMPRSTW